MILLAILAIFGNGYTYQKSFDICKKYDFALEECRWHEEMVNKNPKSMHHKK